MTGQPSDSLIPPDIPGLCRRLVKQLDEATRADLRILVFLMAGSAEEDGSGVKTPLALMYDHLEPKGTPTNHRPTVPPPPAPGNQLPRHTAGDPNGRRPGAAGDSGRGNQPGRCR
jgi:hypothetical protein